MMFLAVRGISGQTTINTKAPDLRLASNVSWNSARVGAVFGVIILVFSLGFLKVEERQCRSLQ